MACGRCDERGRAVKAMISAARRSDLAAMRREAAFVTRTLNEDTKAFAQALRSVLERRS